jgi:hypothetical protein
MALLLLLSLGCGVVVASVALVVLFCSIVVALLWRCCSDVVVLLFRYFGVVGVVALLFRGCGIVVPLFRRCWCCDIVDVCLRNLGCLVY